MLAKKNALSIPASLLITLPTKMREFILFLPVLKFLNREHPSTQIVLVGVAWQEELLAKTDLVFDDFWKSPSAQPHWKFWKTWRSEEKRVFEAFLYGGGNSFVAVWAMKRGIKIRGGRKTEFLAGRVLNYGVEQQRWLSEMHEIEYNLSLLRPLGPDYHAQNRTRYKVRIQTEGLARQNGAHFFLAPSPGVRNPFWSARNFVRFAQRIAEQTNRESHFHFVVPKKDRKTLITLKDELHKIQDRELSELLTLHALANGDDDTVLKLAQECDYFLGHATGPYYLMSAMGKQCLALFNPIMAHAPFRWKSLFLEESTENYLIPEVVCAQRMECAFQKCPYYDCMSKIEVEWVVDHFTENKNGIP